MPSTKEIACQPERRSGSQIRQIRLTVGEQVLRRRQCTFEAALVAKPFRTTVDLQLLVVQLQHGSLRPPDEWAGAHLGSAASTAW